MELEYLKAIDVFEIAVYVWESGEGLYKLFFCNY